MVSNFFFFCNKLSNWKIARGSTISHITHFAFIDKLDENIDDQGDGLSHDVIEFTVTIGKPANDVTWKSSEIVSSGVVVLEGHGPSSAVSRVAAPFREVAYSRKL